MFICCVCIGGEYTTETIEQLEIHIAVEHVHYYAYECDLCESARFPTDYALRQHITHVHRLNKYKVRLE
jgi:hypothetical protein